VTFIETSIGAIISQISSAVAAKPSASHVVQAPDDFEDFDEIVHSADS